MRRPPGASRILANSRRARCMVGGSLASPRLMRSVLKSWSRIRTQRREPRIDAVGHLRGAGLGEGQAEDMLGAHAGQQQAQHARRSAPASCRCPPTPTAPRGRWDRTPRPGRPGARGRASTGSASATRFPSRGRGHRKRRMSDSDKDEEASEARRDETGQGRRRGRHRLGGDRRRVALRVEGQEAARQSGK